MRYHKVSWNTLLLCYNCLSIDVSTSLSACVRTRVILDWKFCTRSSRRDIYIFILHCGRKKIRWSCKKENTHKIIIFSCSPVLCSSHQTVCPACLAFSLVSAITYQWTFNMSRICRQHWMSFLEEALCSRLGEYVHVIYVIWVHFQVQPSYSTFKAIEEEM